MKNKIINTLPYKVQQEIHLELSERGLYEEDIKGCFHGKLSDIRDLINIDKYITEEKIDMEISHAFKLHDLSKEIIKEVYDMYNEVEWEYDKVFSNPIVHLQPTEDTRNDKGELNGFTDALLFTLMVFNQEDWTVMKLDNRDQLDTYQDENVLIDKIRIFKDGSTFIKLRGKYQFGDTQAVTIHPCN